jgi:hypothetical protein
LSGREKGLEPNLLVVFGNLHHFHLVASLVRIRKGGVVTEILEEHNGVAVGERRKVVNPAIVFHFTSPRWLLVLYATVEIFFDGRKKIN